MSSASTKTKCFHGGRLNNHESEVVEVVMFHEEGLSVRDEFERRGGESRGDGP